MSTTTNLENKEFNVIKRNGEYESVSFDKILNRIKKMASLNNEKLDINMTKLAMKIIEQLYDDIKTHEIDELTSQQCASQIITHPDYGVLASRIMISNHHKNTNSSFYEVMKQLYEFTDIHGKVHHMISDELMRISEKYKDQIQDELDFSRDFDFDYFGFKTLERSYLMKYNGLVIERPQHMWMRVAIGVNGENMESVFETYDMLSRKYFTHATPTLFNAGTPRPQLSSCYLLSMEDDSIKGIYNTLGECADISKWAGGIGLHIHNVRAKGSHIRGTNGVSNGIVPMLRVFNNTARYVDQGGGKRNGSFAMYMEPWHADIFEFLEMKKNHGDEEIKARDLFYALWIPDLFMKRVKTNGKWTLMCPDKCKGLSDTYGDDFEQLYCKYESNGMGNKTVDARDLWLKILDSQIETGTPYMLYKDACNMKSNQKNIGTIKSSNLCCEIVEYSDDKETAVCNLASIGLSKFVKPADTSNIKKVVVYGKPNCIYCNIAKATLKKNNIKYTYIDLENDAKRNEFYIKNSFSSMPQIYINDQHIGGCDSLLNIVKPTFDYDELALVTTRVTKNLNNVIDINYYPTEKTRLSNLKHRPVGIGIQGLADVFAMMNIPFTSQEASVINERIFETIYYASLNTSMLISRSRGEAMDYLKQKYEEKCFSFCNTNDDCRKYNITTDNDAKLKEYLEKYQPIFNEFKYNELSCLGAYSTFSGSPASQGKLQFDLWDEKPSDRYDWDSLKKSIQTFGIRNSLLVAPMPTASTSQILGNNECFEPFTSNIYLRRTIVGEFIIINKYLMRELCEIGVWNEDIKNSIILHKGSIQQLTNLPKYIRDKYKIVWEMPMKNLINMSKTRGKYICQSQSMNLWMETPTYDKITAMHFYAWSSGLKTGLYYLRTKAKAAAQQFTIDPNDVKKSITNQNEDDECLMCSG